MGTTADQGQFEIVEEADAAETLQGLIDAAAEMTPPETKTGVARKIEIAEALLTPSGGITHLVELQDKMSDLIERMLGNPLDLSSEAGELTPDELYDLMLEHLDRKDIERLLDVRHKMMKARIFAHIEAVNRTKGVEDPEHAPGEAPVPKLGKRFTREGGKAKATLDHSLLAIRLGPEVAKQVFRTVTTTKVVLDEDALLGMVRENPALLDEIKDCVVPGEYGAARLCVRDIT